VIVADFDRWGPNVPRQLLARSAMTNHKSQITNDQ
jgi:hypothetical protein